MVPGWASDVGGEEHPTMPSGLGSLGDDDIATVALEPDGLGHGRRRRHHDRTRGADSIDELGRGQTEVEADHFGTTPFDELGTRSSSNGFLGGADGARARSTPSSSSKRERVSVHASSVAGETCGAVVAEEVDVDAARPSHDGTRRPGRASCSPVSIAAGSEPEAAGSRHRDGQRNTARTRPSALARSATRLRAEPRAHHRRTPREPYLWPSSRLLACEPMRMTWLWHS